MPFQCGESNHVLLPEDILELLVLLHSVSLFLEDKAPQENEYKKSLKECTKRKMD